jgi:hypothetical protein
MKKPWHNRKNTHQAKHRRSRFSRARAVKFQEPTPIAPRFRPNGKPGTKPEAVILDMDGTLENWDGWPNSHAMEYAQAHHDQGRVLIVITARDHEWSYKRTHDWLRDHLHLPFVGPICRPADDERYACDFKKHVYEQLSAVYDIVSAIDDDGYVLGMWRSIPGLEVIETSYDYNVARGQRRNQWKDLTDNGASFRSCSDLSVYEPDDEYDWDALEGRIKEAKRGNGRSRWGEDNVEGMDLFCHHCDHPWFEHDITGCTTTDACPCAG